MTHARKKLADSMRARFAAHHLTTGGLAVALLVLAGCHNEQSSHAPAHSEQHAERETTSPHAGQNTRPIAALSPGEIKGYRQGAGMGFAKAAELNRYPGPRHVLDLGDRLDLTAEQRQAVQAQFDRMREQAVALGTEIIEQERVLDSLFEKGQIELTALQQLTRRIGMLNGELRAVHLRAHLRTRDILSGEQVQRYNSLRGYGQAGAGHHPMH